MSDGGSGQTKSFGRFLTFLSAIFSPARRTHSDIRFTIVVQMSVDGIQSTRIFLIETG